MNEQREGRVSAIIPARNEEENITRAVASLALQAQLSELIVVDDQSEDGTPQLLAKLKEQYPVLRTVRLNHLPPGWMGKTHAAAEGARLTTGEWLLFTDADTVHRPGSLGILLQRAEGEGTALLSISPGQTVETWWEKAVIPAIYTELARLFRFEDVSDPRSTAAAANGQYILVRRAVYQSVGGWEAVRDAVLDDVAFARRVKSAGGKILFLPGAAWAETRMYRRFADMWCGWTKNLYLLYGCASGRLGKAAARFVLFGFLPFALLALFSALLILDAGGRIQFGVPAIACGLAAGASASRYNRSIERLGFSGALAIYLPAGALLAAFLLLSSLWAYRRRGQIKWKGRVYPAKGTL
ncbi:MAG: glycosyltransferase [Terriglobia bacterium]